MRYRHAWPGFLLLGSLALLLGALLAWGDHFLSPGPSGGIRRLLQLGAASRPALPSGQTAEPERAADPPSDPASPPGPTGSVSSDQTEPPGPAQPRYALDLGTFVIIEEAERAEAQLNQAGFSTVRFRNESAQPGQVTVRHGNFASREEAAAIGREISRLGVPNEVVEIH